MSNFIPIYAVDFDGTLCESRWPGIGEPNTELINDLIERREEGAKIILWTCRIEDRLEEAVQWCKEQGLEFDAVNDNLPETIALHGNNCRKIFATVYIDDKSMNRLAYELPYHPSGSEVKSEYEKWYPVGSRWMFKVRDVQFPVMITGYSNGGESMKIESVSKDPTWKMYSCRREFVWFVGKLFPLEESFVKEGSTDGEKE